MKQTIIRNFRLHPLFLAACTLILASCYSDEDSFPDPSLTDGRATVQLSVTSERVDAGHVVRVGGDANAYNHEYMNHFCVLVVDQNNILRYKFYHSGEDDPLAEEGMLEEATSEPVELEVGTYSLYGFANWDGLDNETLNRMSTLGVGDNIASYIATLKALQLPDPASKVRISDEDFNNGLQVFIPMCGKAENLEVTETTTTLSVGLDRLVSRVKITLDLEEGGETVGDDAYVTFSGYAPVVGLFDEVNSLNEISDALPLPEGQSEWTTLSRDIARIAGTTEAGDIEFRDVYVNETRLDKPFTVTLHTGNTAAGVTEYTATTALDDLPRNRIYPLTLTLSGWQLGLQVKGWKSPIDEYPLELNVSQTNEDTYTVTGLCEGGQFQLSIPTVTGESGPVNVDNVVWNIPNSPWGIQFDGGTDSHVGTTVKGSFSGDDRLIGKSFTVQAQVTWTDNNTTYERTYNIVLAELKNIATAATRSLSTRSLLTPCWLQPEILTLYMKK
ncbi:MAG: hypothetical protein ACOYJE_05190 [Bacteroidaceae bacterium]